ELIDTMTRSFEDAARSITDGNRPNSKETNLVKNDQRKIQIASGHLRGMAAKWYKDNRDEIIYWKRDGAAENSFHALLVTFFTTPEKQHKWQLELNTLAQGRNEKVDAYATKFKKLLSRVDPLPESYTCECSLGGLKGKTATFVAVTSPRDLNEAIVAARKVEAGDYYSTHTSETTQSTDKKDELIEALVKQVQQLSVNYVALNNKKEKDIPEPERRCDNYREPRREIVCYGCGEMGHIARYSDEPEKKLRLQAESRWKNRLRQRRDEEPPLVDLNNTPDLMEEDEFRPILKPRRRRELSIVDKLAPYNIAQDLLNAPANVTYGQMLQYETNNGIWPRLFEGQSPPKKLRLWRCCKHNDQETLGQAPFEDRSTLDHGNRINRRNSTFGNGLVPEGPSKNPLRRATKGVSYEWGNQQQDAFEKLKEHLISAPILRYPDFDKTFYLHTDASGTGLGAVLAQKGEKNKEHVISYASRSLSKAERNYSATESECLATVRGGDGPFGVKMAADFEIEGKKSPVDPTSATLQLYDRTPSSLETNESKKNNETPIVIRPPDEWDEELETEEETYTTLAEGQVGRNWDDYEDKSGDETYDPGYSHNYHLGAGEAWWDLTEEEEYGLKERECIYLLENILAEPERGEDPYHRLDENLPRPSRNEVRRIMEEANGWYEEEVVAFLATTWDESEIDEELNGGEPITNSDTDDRQFDPYDDEKYVGEPYKKEVRYTMILESIVLEAREADLASTDDKEDNDPSPIDKNEEKEHIRCAKEELNRIHDSNPSEIKRHRDSLGNAVVIIQEIEELRECQGRIGKLKEKKRILKPDDKPNPAQVVGVL
ncbi:3519_t:CDS:10, partial [Cetraspora pellucida]